jgi:hypothetical protein
LDNVTPVLVRSIIRELDQLEPGIRDVDGLRPRLLHGDYSISNTAVGPVGDGHLEVVAVFEFESERDRSSEAIRARSGRCCPTPPLAARFLRAARPNAAPCLACP